MLPARWLKWIYAANVALLAFFRREGTDERRPS